MFKRLIVGALALLGLLAVVLVGNALRQGSRQLQVAPVPVLAVDEVALADTMARAVRARTVSGLLDPAGQAVAFDALHALLRERFPLAHTTLTREVVGAHSLIYTWKGSDAAARPVLLMAHQDVVPIAPGTDKLWKHPPFDGVIADGFVWGRGTLDDKSNVVTQLAALEALLQAGFQPRRSIVFFFGHDEEVGGELGAVKAVALFKQRGVRFEFVLDEGLAVTEGILPGVKQPLALVGLAEKGTVTLRLTATAAPGHSSTPPAPGHSAIGRLSAALTRLDQNPMPGGIRGAAGAMFDALAPDLPLAQRLALSNLWLTRPLVERQLGQGGATNALMRTTTAMTIVNAGNKENVLPGRAEAVVNFRILPGDSAASVAEHVKRVVADPAVEVTQMGVAAEPSRLSSPEGAPFKLIERAVREVFPDALVAPGLMLAASDARHFDAVSEQSFRFMPVRFGPEDLARPHGTDERIAIKQLADMVRFYHRLLQLAAGAPGNPSGNQGKQP